MYSNLDNSIMSKIDAIKIQAHTNEYDAMLFVEIKPKNGQMPEEVNMRIPGYMLYLGNLEDNHTRGTCIYIKDCYESSKVKIPDSNFQDTTSAEVLFGKNRRVLLQVIYRSGSPGTAALYDDAMMNHMKTTSNLPNYSNMIIAGDFNLNQIKWTPDPIVPNTIRENSIEHKFTECVRDCYFHQYVREPTRYRHDHTPTCDDLIFSSRDTDIDGVKYNPSIGKSDHLALTFELEVENRILPPRKTIYLYDKGDYFKLCNMLDVDWETMLKGLNVEDSMKLFEEAYYKAEKECVPTKVIINDRIPKPPWMSKSALRQIKRKHSSWIRYLNTKRGEDYLKYIKERNDATKEIRKSRKEYEKEIAKACRKNQKGVWKYMKSCHRVRSMIPRLRKPGGDYTTSDVDIAETLAEQYNSAFTQEDATNIPNIPSKSLLTEKLTSFQIKHEAVLKILKSLDPNKSTGVDKIHPRVLKEAAEKVALPITIIANKSLKSAILPRNWLDAQIIPIYKKDDRQDPANYRPVSLTSIICKIVEKVIAPQVIKHIMDNQNYNSKQHGFTVGRSTTTNILEAMNIWTEALHHNVPIDVIFLDYSKAFDSVPHKRLIKQVQSFGIEGEALRWIEAFLNTRRQKVLANGAQSNWYPVVSGIPQGSILGPILFSLFVNDIPKEIRSHISMFADDSKIYLPLHTDMDNYQLQQDILDLEDWACKMQMKFHPDKCHVLHLGNNNPMHMYYMHSGSDLHLLKEVAVEKDLGIHTDNKLTYNVHIQEKINKANKTLGYIRHTFKYLDKENFLMLYKSLVRPHLEYGSTIWSPHFKYHIDAIERVQRRATRLVPGMKHLTYEERLENLGLETLEYRRRRADILELYRIMNEEHQLDLNCYCAKCPAKSMFQPALSNTTRGNSRKLQIQEALSLRHHFFATGVTPQWNKLSNEVVTAKNINIFKSHIEKEMGNSKYTYKFSY